MNPALSIPIPRDGSRYPKDVWPGHKPSGQAGGGNGGLLSPQAGTKGGADAVDYEFFCDRCDDTIPAGKERMECAVCPDDFCLCQACFDELDVRLGFMLHLSPAYRQCGPRGNGRLLRSSPQTPRPQVTVFSLGQSPYFHSSSLEGVMRRYATSHTQSLTGRITVDRG